VWTKSDYYISIYFGRLNQIIFKKLDLGLLFFKHLRDLLYIYIQYFKNVISQLTNKFVFLNFNKSKKYYIYLFLWFLLLPFSSMESFPSLSYGFFANPNFLSLKLFSLLLSLFLPTNSFFSFLYRESSFTLPICACVSLDSSLILSNSHTRWVLRLFNFFFPNFSSCVTSNFDSLSCFRLLWFVAAT